MSGRKTTLRAIAAVQRSVYSLIGSCALCAVAPGQQVTADQGATGASGDGEVLGEVVVTALRRDTDLQRTPVSVAAISADTLAQKGALDFIDFASSVPGFTMLDNGPGERRPIIRGIEGAGEAEVGTYYDEFPIASSPGATNDAGRFAPDIKLIDVQQVEVLRGPQGTLFGSGSEGGTLQTIFNKPNLDAFAGNLSTQVGQITHGGPQTTVNGMVNLPIISNTLGVRIVGYQTTEGGYIDNVQLGVNDINKGYTRGGRLALKYVPTDRLTFDVLLLYHQAHYDAGNASIASLGDLTSNIPAYDPLDDQVNLFGATAKYRFDFATLTADASYFKRSLDFNFTFPGLPIPFTSPLVLGNSLVEQPQTTRATTYEARLNAPDARSAFQWTVGGFFQNRDNWAASVLPFVGADGEPDPAYPLFQNRTILGTLDQRAAYAEVSYRFFDKLTATAGGRWAKFDTSTSTAYLIDTGGAPGTNTYVTQNFSDSKFVKRFSLSYQLTDAAMVYATYSEGFRAGGANQAILGEPVPAGYGPDTVHNYEGGFKSQWLGRRLTFNIDYYHMIWNEIQVSGATPDGLFDYTTNAGRAGVDGVELEAAVRPIDNLKLGTTFGFTHARLTASEPFVPGATESGFAGDAIPAVPDKSLNVSADYTRPLSGTLSTRLHAEYQYVGKSQNLLSSTLADPTTGDLTAKPDPYFYRQPAYSVVNARWGLESGAWTAALFANNLTDRRGVTDIFADIFRPGGYTYTIMPRVVGLSVSVNF